MRYRLIISWGLIILVGLIIFASIGIYSVVNLIPQYEQKIELMVSKKLGAKVDFKIDKIKWKGLEPVINVRDISIDNPKKDYTLSLSHVVVKLNLIDSLLTWKPSADAIEIDNLDISLKLNKNNNKSNDQDYDLSQKEVMNSIVSMLNVLTNQNTIIFKNAVITLKTEKKNIVIPFKISWNKEGYGQYRLVLDARMENKNHIKLLLDVQSSIFFGISAAGKLKLNFKDVGSYLSEFINSNYELKQGDADLQAKFNIEHGDLRSAITHVKITNLYLGNQNPLEQPINITKFETSLNYQFDAKTWGLEFSNMFMSICGQHSKINRLAVYGQLDQLDKQEANKLRVSISNIDLGFMDNTYHALIGFFGVNTTKLDFLKDIDIFGHLKKIDILISQVNSKIKHWEIESIFNNIGINNYKSKVSVKNFSGKVYVSNNKGWILVDSPKLKFNGNRILESPVPEVKVKTLVQWNKSNGLWRINLNDLGFNTSGLAVKVFGSVEIPEKNPDQTLVKVYGFINGVDIGNKFTHFLPKLGINPDLYAWLTQSIKVVKQVNGFFLIDGPIMKMPFQHNEGQFTVGVDVLGASFYPFTDWPLIEDTNTRLLFHNQEVEILGMNGHSEGANVKYASFLIPNIAPGVPSYMQINGEVDAKNNQSNRYIKNSPLIDNVGLLIKNVDYQGKVNVNLSLHFPLGDPTAENKVKGIVHVHGGTANIKQIDVNVYNLEGSVAFENNGYTIKRLTGWFNPQAPLSVNLSSQQINKNSYIYSGSLEASLPLEVFDKNMPFRIKQNINGYLPVDVNFKVSEDDGGEIKFKSSLVDVESTLPIPLKFDKGLIMPLYGDIGWDSEFNTFHGNLNINGEPIASIDADMKEKNKIPLIFSLSMPELNAMQWVNFFDSHDESLQPLIYRNGLLENWHQYQFDHSDKVFSQSWYCPNMMPNISCLVKNIMGYIRPGFHLKIGKLDVYNHKFDNFKIDSNASSQEISIKVSDDEKGGLSLKIPLDGYSPWDLALNDIKVLNTHQVKKSNQEDESKSISSPEVDVSTLSLIPPMNVLIKNLSIFNRSVHNSKFSLIPLYDGIAVSSFMIKDKGDSLVVGSAKFQGHPLQANFAVKATSKNWGQLLGFYGYKDVLEGGNGPITADFNWKNTYVPDVPTLSGKVMFDVQDGVIEKIKPGLSKLIGIFSINTYLARLTTSYSDFTTSGMMFNKIMGKYILDNGIANTDPKIQIFAPSFDAIITGGVDFKDNKIDQKVTLQPHLSGIFAIAAGVLGGPIVGVATYLLEELVTHTLLKNSGLITLHIIGDLSDPKVTKEAL